MDFAGLDGERMRQVFALEEGGAALTTHGLVLPLTHPETAWLIALERLPL